MAGIKINPAEGYGAHIRDVRALSEVVDTLDNPLTYRFTWKAAQGSPTPEYQLCVGDDVANVIQFSDVTVPDDRVSVDLGTGVITINTDVKDLDLFATFEVYRGVSGGGTVTWGCGIQIFVPGTGWIDVPDSTRYMIIPSQDTNLTTGMGYSYSGRNFIGGTQYRLVQACSDSSKDVGLISDKPLTSLPISAGVVVSLAGR